MGPTAKKQTTVEHIPSILLWEKIDVLLLEDPNYVKIRFGKLRDIGEPQ